MRINADDQPVHARPLACKVTVQRGRATPSNTCGQLLEKASDRAPFTRACARPGPFWKTQVAADGFGRARLRVCVFPRKHLLVHVGPSHHHSRRFRYRPHSSSHRPSPGSDQGTPTSGQPNDHGQLQETPGERGRTRPEWQLWPESSRLDRGGHPSDATRCPRAPQAHSDRSAPTATTLWQHLTMPRRSFSSVRICREADTPNNASGSAALLPPKDVVLHPPPLPTAHLGASGPACAKSI